MSLHLVGFQVDPMDLDKSGFREFMDAYLERRPRSTVQDVYKLLYQGVFGVNHIMGGEALHRLIEEAERVMQLNGYEDPLLESASPDGYIVRVNLRPFIRIGGNLMVLFNAMEESVDVKEDNDSFTTLWRWFKEAYVPQVFEEASIRDIDEDLRSSGPRPRHHSDQYREAYYPAYRVIKRSALKL
jgi:hypothetical protein